VWKTRNRDALFAGSIHKQRKRQIVQSLHEEARHGMAFLEDLAGSFSRKVASGGKSWSCRVHERSVYRALVDGTFFSDAPGKYSEARPLASCPCPVWRRLAASCVNMGLFCPLPAFLGAHLAAFLPHLAQKPLPWPF
jgi:hypothetical protein